MDTQFQQVDFGPIKQFLDNDDVTDISYSNGGQVWLKTLSKGVYRVECFDIDKDLYEQWIGGSFTKCVLKAKNKNHLY